MERVIDRRHSVYLHLPPLGQETEILFNAVNIGTGILWQQVVRCDTRGAKKGQVY